MGWGKSKYDKGTFKKTGKPAKGPGDNFIRPLPAMHSLAESGQWAVWKAVHWGYGGVSRGDPSKASFRPFLCIEQKDRRTKMVTQNCPECDNIQAHKEEAEAYLAQLKAQTPKLDLKAIETAMKSREDWLQSHNCERKWYINVMYHDRTFGDYKINHGTHKVGIDTKIKELLAMDEPIDATALDQGVFFNIKRIGNGFTPPDVIEVEHQMVDAEVNGKKTKVPMIVTAPLTEDEANRALLECRDLATLGGEVLTFEQIQALVNCSGDPEEVDAIFGGRVVEPASAKVTATEPIQPAQSTGTLTVTKTETVTSTPSTPAAQSTPAPAAKVNPVTEAMQKRAADIRAKAAVAAAEAAKKAAEAAAAAPAASEPVDPTIGMNDEEYMKFFESTMAGAAGTST